MDSCFCCSAKKNMREVVIVGMARTPVGKFRGILSSLTAVELGIIAVEEALKRAQITPDQVQEVVGGQVYGAGTKGNPARQVQLACGIPVSAGAVTVEQQCASSMRALEIASQQIILGKTDVSVAFGMESMSNVPHLLMGIREGVRMGELTVRDSLLYDALEDAFIGKHMGITAENLAQKYNISRLEQDEYAVMSHQRAVAAQNRGDYDAELIPLEVRSKKDIILVTQDEGPNPATTVSSISGLRPAFLKDGTVTAGNASSMNDGAAAVVLMEKKLAESKGLPILAELAATATVGVEPEVMGIGPVAAIPKALAYAGLTLDQIGYFEINEAFAAQILAVNKELKIPMDKLNVNGSGISLGHPVGCTGVRIVIALITEMARRNCRYGCASLCVGGGPAMAAILKLGNC